MIEIRFHGRGGQGAVLASELLAQAAFRDGKTPQSFPFFGVERRGAPVTAFCRLDERAIRVRTAITAPGIVVVLDAGLLRSTPVTDGLVPGGLLLVNTRSAPGTLDAPPGVRRASVDATGIALENGLGTAMLPIVNTAILGALAAASGVVSLGALQEAISEFVPARPASNFAAARAGFDRVRSAPPRPPAPFPIAPPSPRPAAVAALVPEGPMATRPSDQLRTASWRTMRPELHLEKCTRCNFCWKYCPDDAFSFDAAGFPVLRSEYCKGCGICAAECPPRAIEMIAEGA